MNQNDLMARVVQLLEAAMTAQGIALPAWPEHVTPPPAAPGWTLDGQRRLGRELADVARTMNRRRRGEVDAEDDETEDTLPPSGGTDPDTFWKRRT